MKEMQAYERWLSYPLEDADLKAELSGIAGKEDEIYERFYKELEFGTAGLRGVIGAGSNRMNIYTVRKATQGLAQYLVKKSASPKAAIGYDSRNKSILFAQAAAAVLAANGVKTYLYQELMPTPMLSFAVRELGCDAGIVITASHNPAKYNGYKAYGPDGCQMTDVGAAAVFDEISHVDVFDGVKNIPFEKGLAAGMIEYITDEVIEKYLGNVKAQQIRPDAAAKAGLKLVYTPLNGTGNKPVREILKRTGVEHIVIVPEQEYPDGNFPTCPYPNPEIKETLQKGLDLCKQEQADLLLATDPDADRVGIAVKTGDDYVLLTGNEVGALLTDYILKNRTAKGDLPNNPIVVKTIVTTKLIDAIAAKYGVQVINVLTGFKYIGEQILNLEQKGEENRYIFGFEESYGYLCGTYVRDKDAVVASMLIVEMASAYKLEGKTLMDALNELYASHGIFIDTQNSFTCEGVTGMEKIAGIMGELRSNPPKEIAGLAVNTVADYEASVRVTGGKSEEIHLPKSNVLEFGMDGASVIVRPSGTEPKIKVYYSIKGETREKAEALLGAARKQMTAIVE